MINLELLKPVMLGDHLQQYPFQILPGRLACFMGRSVTNGTCLVAAVAARLNFTAHMLHVWYILPTFG